MKIEINDRNVEFLHKYNIPYIVIRTLENSFLEINRRELNDKQLYQLKKLNRKI